MSSESGVGAKDLEAGRAGEFDVRDANEYHFLHGDPGPMWMCIPLTR